MSLYQEVFKTAAKHRVYVLRSKDKTKKRFLEQRSSFGWVKCALRFTRDQQSRGHDRDNDYERRVETVF